MTQDKVIATQQVFIILLIQYTTNNQSYNKSQDNNKKRRRRSRRQRRRQRSRHSICRSTCRIDNIYRYNHVDLKLIHYGDDYQSSRHNNSMTSHWIYSVYEKERILMIVAS
jgi:hypothetical protein